VYAFLVPVVVSSFFPLTYTNCTNHGSFSAFDYFRQHMDRKWLKDQYPVRALFSTIFLFFSLSLSVSLSLSLSLSISFSHLHTYSLVLIGKDQPHRYSLQFTIHKSGIKQNNYNKKVLQSSGIK
jgi:hypothetical protein